MNDAHIFCIPHKYNKAKRKLIKACTKDLFVVQLVEFSNREYALGIVMPFKKDIFGNWIEKQMCDDCQLINS